MIIFGFRTTAKVVAALFLTCGRCRSVAAQRLVHRRRWFTLFFVPIFPFSSSYVMTCACCGSASSLTHDGAERFRADAQAVEDQRVRSETLPAPTWQQGR